MNNFVNAVKNQDARTENGMKARLSTANSLTDLFFKIGAMRGQNVTAAWTAARVNDPYIAGRIALWARDVRSGAGERKIFRDILVDMIKTDPDRALALMGKIPEIGRWDDILVFLNTSLEIHAIEMIRKALINEDHLCAKWMPRKGADAVRIRQLLAMTPKQYRKTLVRLTNVVETKMCAKQWDEIDFNHVPSLASARYKKAFSRHSTLYKEWAEKLVSADPTVRETVKVNAGAVYPYDVLKGLSTGGHYVDYDIEHLNHIQAQWEALPNYVGDASILPLVDVSGSMVTPISNGSTVRVIDVAVSLGLYLADKNRGSFKDTFLTFSGNPELIHMNGNIIDKLRQMNSSKWTMNTNLHAAMERIIEVAIKGKVLQEEMPSTLLILSDMQFDSCVAFDDSAMEMIERRFTNAGYQVPRVVFWNLRDAGNVPVKFNEKGVALVSGFSPSIVKAVLAADMSEFSPEAIMMKTIMSDRYNY